MNPNHEKGKFTAPGEIRFVRLLPGPIERVWSYLTEEEKRKKWFAGGAMDLRAGGQAELIFRHSQISPQETPPEKHREHHEPGTKMACEITRCEPPRVLAFTWWNVTPEVGSEVTFELLPHGHEVQLVLTHRRLGLDRAELAGTASGWHTHLDLLIARLNGATPPPIWATASRYETDYFPLADETLGKKPRPIARVTHRFASQAERVFDAWLNPAQVRRWLADSGSMKHLQRVSLDPQIGGHFSFVDRREGRDVDHVGKYLEIDRPRRLKFTWGIGGVSVDQSTVTLNVVPVDGGCELFLTHEMDPAWADYVERTRAGWTKMVGGIDAVLRHG